MEQMNLDSNLQHWAALIEDALSSGLTREAWCEEHGISKWTYYYWNRKIKRLRETDRGQNETGRRPCSMQPETSPVFYELPAAVTDPYAEMLKAGMKADAGSSMILEFGVYKLTIPQDVDANALQTVIRAVNHA